jgi:hypothetical protein
MPRLPCLRQQLIDEGLLVRTAHYVSHIAQTRSKEEGMNFLHTEQC